MGHSQVGGRSTAHQPVAQTPLIVHALLDRGRDEGLHAASRETKRRLPLLLRRPTAASLLLQRHSVQSGQSLSLPKLDELGVRVDRRRLEKLALARHFARDLLAGGNQQGQVQTKPAIGYRPIADRSSVCGRVGFVKRSCLCTATSRRNTHRSCLFREAEPTHPTLGKRRNCTRIIDCQCGDSPGSRRRPGETYSLQPATPALSRHPPFRSFCATCNLRRQSCTRIRSGSSPDTNAPQSGSPRDLLTLDRQSNGNFSRRQQLKRGKKETHRARHSETSRAVHTLAERSASPCKPPPACPCELRRRW